VAKLRALAGGSVGDERLRMLLREAGGDVNAAVDVLLDSNIDDEGEHEHGGEQGGMHDDLHLRHLPKVRSQRLPAPLNGYLSLLIGFFCVRAADLHLRHLPKARAAARQGVGRGDVAFRGPRRDGRGT